MQGAGLAHKEQRGVQCLAKNTAISGGTALPPDSIIFMSEMLKMCFAQPWANSEIKSSLLTK